MFDHFSKAVHFILLLKLPSAAETEGLLVKHVFCLHGLPRDNISPGSTVYATGLEGLLWATVSLSSGYHPQSNGQSEKANRSLERILHCVSARNPSSWGSFLPWLEYVHNSLVLASTRVSLLMAWAINPLCSRRRWRCLQFRPSFDVGELPPPSFISQGSEAS